MQSDPLGVEAGPNTYAYVGGNPAARADPFGLVWEYSQSTGHLWHFPPGGGAADYAGQGYSGFGNGLNNGVYSLCRADKPNCGGDAGPIPEGNYTIGPAHTSPRGRMTMDLTPGKGTNTFGRNGFEIHGDNSCVCGTASIGCIILGPDIRKRISTSGDRNLRVVP